MIGTDRCIRIGIVGCGSVSGAYAPMMDWLHERGLAEVTWGCDVVVERAQALRDRFGESVRATAAFEDLVASDEVDLVLILTPMQEHGRITLAALDAGKHVLVEKPMASTLEEGAEIMNSAKRASGYLVCAPHIILSPTYQAMWKRIVHLREIGAIHLARGRYGWSGPSWGPWYYRPGGGAVFDLAVYNLTSLTGLIGPVRRVVALTGTAVPERQVDGHRVRVEAVDNAQLSLDFGNGVFGAVTTGFTMQQYRGAALELYGSEGTIQMLGDDWAPEGYELWRRDRRVWEVFPESDPNWHWTEGLRHLVGCIRERRQPLVTPEHAYHVLEIMVRAQDNGLTGEAGEIASTFPPLRLSADEIVVEPDTPKHDRRIQR